jgi:hypothetical protein
MLVFLINLLLLKLFHSVLTAASVMYCSVSCKKILKYTWRKWSWLVVRFSSPFLWHSQHACLLMVSFRACLTNLWWKFWSANTVRFFLHCNEKCIKVLHRVSEVALCFSSRFWYWVGLVSQMYVLIGSVHLYIEKIWKLKQKRWECLIDWSPRGCFQTFHVCRRGQRKIFFSLLCSFYPCTLVSSNKIQRCTDSSVPLDISYTVSFHSAKYGCLLWFVYLYIATLLHVHPALPSTF